MMAGAARLHALLGRIGGMRKKGLPELVAALSCAGFLLTLQASTAQVHHLAQAHAIHDLPAAKATHHYPVRLRAVLTFYDPYVDQRRGAIFVCDNSGCVFVSVPLRPVLPIRAGDLLDIDGVTGPGDFATIVEAAHVKTIGHLGLPRNAHKVTMEDLASGVYDTDWIQIQGRVKSIHREPNIVSLVVSAKGGSFGAVTLPEAGMDYDRLVDSLVEITANTAPAFNQRRQMVAVHLFFPSMRQVRVIENAPADPFKEKPTSALDLFRFSPGANVVHRVHIRGAVTLNWAGRMLCIQDGDSSLCMQVTQTDAAKAGSRVDVVGFPAIRSFKPTLEYATFHTAGGTELPLRPVEVNADHVFTDDLDGKLVQIDAELVGRDSTTSDVTLVLRANGVLFSVILPRELSPALPDQWKDGSLLRVTGICSTQVNTDSIGIGDGIVRPEAVKLLLRDAKDIVVLRAPSWWTPRHAWEALASFAIVVMVCLGWIGILRHLVKRRTMELHESQERLRYLSEHDSLTGLPNRILLHERLCTAITRAHRFNDKIGLLMVDLDGFKKINDQKGHKAGDQLLEEVAQRFIATVRATDTVARVGGDEFVILLVDIHHAIETEQVAAKLLSALSEPIAVDGELVQIRGSIGMSVFPDDSEDEESLMRIADEAMYRAKRSGKNPIERQNWQVTRLETTPAFNH
jgi:diguanylate cyclase (GGDEF)-like protein